MRFDPEVRAHRSLAFFTDVDRDLRCVFDLLVHLSTYYGELNRVAFLSVSVYEEIARSYVNDDIRFVSDFKLRLAMSIIQHLCTRLRTTSLKQQLIEGMIVFYHYYYFHLLQRSEEKIVEQLKDFDVRPVDLTLLHDRDFIVTFVTLQASLGAKVVPSYVITVPWTECLKLVGHRQVPLYMGNAYLHYMQVAAWATQRWTSGFRYWVEHDLAVTLPMMDAHLLSSYHDRSSAEFKAYRMKVNRDLSVILMRDHFYTSLPTDLDAQRFLRPIYAQLFHHAAQSDHAPTATTASQLKTAFASFDDYIPIMPPCILSLYHDTLKQRTHFKFGDRFTFFTWAFKTGMPLHLLENMWTRMCEQDEQAVREGKVPTLLREPAITYAKHQASATQVNMNGCESLQKARHCAFIEDIEDLVKRKQSCITYVCGPTSKWHEYAANWSPMAATRAKLKQK